MFYWKQSFTGITIFILYKTSFISKLVLQSVRAVLPGVEELSWFYHFKSFWGAQKPDCFLVWMLWNERTISPHALVI